MQHLMVDVESLGNRPGCKLVSVGAVYFNPQSCQLGETFYRAIKLDRQEGLHTDESTVQWWMKQSDKARAVFHDAAAVYLVEALQDFKDFVGQNGGEKTLLWSHGANFDYPLLAAAMHSLGWQMPMPFWNSRCTRTIFDLAGAKKKDLDAQRDGEHHNALADAVAQARLVCLCYEKMGMGQKVAA